jgi:phosphoribosyl 1,2-cyclic phosphodiesterase
MDAGMDARATNLCDDARLCVLSSSSKGNSSALVVSGGGRQALILIDAGLSPRRTRELLAGLGIDLPVSAIVLTHLDHDHFHQGWLSERAGLPEGGWLYLHKRHRNRAQRAGVLYSPTRVFEDDSFEVAPGVHVSPVLMSHDSLGAAAFRVDFAYSGRSLGYATDLGRATQRLIDHLQGVDVLAIESNYCPNLQAWSGRPEYLRRRITHGSGHLSNEQAAEAVRAIQPREHVVLLHLSLECNRPELAAMHFSQCPCKVTIAGWEQPTPWVQLTWPQAPRRDARVTTLVGPIVTRRPVAPQRTPTLWESVGAGAANTGVTPSQDS